tara:strand:- start:31 stop:417 length:387 start_codon:yes stop_codon:yes gene_type:complete
MKKLITVLLTGFIAGFFSPAQAGPPEGMVRQMVPLPSMCLPATAAQNHFAVLMAALIRDYGVHISMTFSSSPDQSQRVAIIENPHSGLAGVLMISDDQSCIAFSGEDRKVFVRPPDHPTGTENMDTET